MNWWRRTSVFYKILSAFLFAMVLFGAFDTYLVITLSRIETITSSLVDHYAVLNKLSVLAEDNNALADAVKSFILTRDASWQATYDGKSAEIDTLFKTLLFDPNVTLAEKASIAQIKQKLGGIQGTELLVLAKVSAGDVTGANQLFNSYYISEQHDIDVGVSLLVEERTIDVANLIAQNNATIGALRAVIAILFVVFIVLFLLLWLGLSRGLVRPIERLTEVVEKIGEGDLSAAIDVESSDEIGQLAQAFSAMTTKIREAYATLQKEQAQLLASINSLPFGFVIVDARRNTVMTNQVAKGLFKGGAPTLEDMAKLFGKEAEIANAYRSVVEEGMGREVGDATLGDRFFRVVITPIMLAGAEKSVIGSVILFEDVTERKRLDQSKTAFVAIASHEMRTPLTVIRGNAELMLDDAVIKENGGLKTQMESILKSAVRLLSIVNDFLDIQNLEESKITLKIEPVDLKKLLHETIADLRKLAEGKDITLIFDEAAVPDVPILKLDKYRIQQIYTNLISNAIHYTERGTLTAWLEKQEKTVKIFFKDTGIGMGEEERVHLFKKFQTGKSFLRSKEYGSGMGLYISRFLARLMGGDVTLEESGVNMGSTFCLTLPLTPQLGALADEGRHEVVV